MSVRFLSSEQNEPARWDMPQPRSRCSSHPEKGFQPRFSRAVVPGGVASSYLSIHDPCELPRRHSVVGGSLSRTTPLDYEGKPHMCTPKAPCDIGATPGSPPSSRGAAGSLLVLHPQPGEHKAAASNADSAVRLPSSSAAERTRRDSAGGGEKPQGEERGDEGGGRGKGGCQLPSEHLQGPEMPPPA